MPWSNTETLRRLRTPRLLLRCWTEADVPRLMQAIEANLDNLRPWMPWAEHEPQSVEEKTKLVRLFRLRFETGRDLLYGIFDPDEMHVLGACGLHARIGAGAAEIGYWIHTDHVNKGYATEASAALVHVAFERLNLQLVEIHCDVANEPSAGIPRKLGFEELPEIKGWVTEPSGTPRNTLIFRMTAGDYAKSAAAGTEVSISP